MIDNGKFSYAAVLVGPDATTGQYGTNVTYPVTAGNGAGRQTVESAHRQPAEQLRPQRLSRRARSPIARRLGCEQQIEYAVSDGRTIVRRRTTRALQRVSGGAVVTGLLAGHALAAAPVDAVSGVTRVTKSSASNSKALKQVAAICSAGTRVVGGDGTVVNGGGQVAIQRLELRRTATDDRFIAGAHEDQTAFPGSWRLIAYALCADPLPGQHITSNPLRASSDPVQRQFAFCPSGQAQIGYGGRVDNGAGQAHVTELFDFFGPPVGVTFLRAREDTDGYAGSWGGDAVRGVPRHRRGDWVRESLVRRAVLTWACWRLPSRPTSRRRCRAVR